jgi:phage terminase small subunit
MMVTGPEQYMMPKDYYKLALAEWKRNHPFLRRESDLSNEDRQWILDRAAEMERNK